jgi:hypothetical protein
MAYIYGLVVVALFFGVMHFFTALNVKEKVTATLLTLIFVMGALYYNTVQDENAAHTRDVMLRFNQDQSLDCGGVEVNSTNFSLSVGTQTFIGKKESSASGIMVIASDCK